jgi:hypothetical protein
MSAEAFVAGAMPSGMEISPVSRSMAGGVADPQT